MATNELTIHYEENKIPSSVVKRAGRSLSKVAGSLSYVEADTLKRVEIRPKQKSGLTLANMQKMYILQLAKEKEKREGVKDEKHHENAGGGFFFWRVCG